MVLLVTTFLEVARNTNLEPLHPHPQPLHDDKITTIQISNEWMLHDKPPASGDNADGVPGNNVPERGACLLLTEQPLPNKRGQLERL